MLNPINDFIFMIIIVHFIYLSSKRVMAEWLSEVHSSTNELGSAPLGVEVNLANPALPALVIVWLRNYTCNMCPLCLIEMAYWLCSYLKFPKFASLILVGSLRDKCSYQSLIRPQKECSKRGDYRASRAMNGMIRHLFTLDNIFHHEYILKLM